MTALEEYQKLEATGLWRDVGDSQRREVLINLGNTSLIISTLSETALTHWSLAAVIRVNPGELPALYVPVEGSDESLEIADEHMIAAIEKLRSMIDRHRPHPGRLRGILAATTAAVVLGLGLFWLPDALVRQTVHLLPEAKKREIGRDILTEMIQLTGPSCNQTAGQAALAALARRVFIATPTVPRLVVLRDGLPASLHLPGDLIVLNRSVVEDYQIPDVLAGFLLSEYIRLVDSNPTQALLQEAGLWATFRLLTTGEISDTHLAARAASLLTETPTDVADEALLSQFAQAEISSQPYAYALDISGENTLSLIEADPLRTAQNAPLLEDTRWVALQEICTE